MTTFTSEDREAASKYSVELLIDELYNTKFEATRFYAAEMLQKLVDENKKLKAFARPILCDGTDDIGSWDSDALQELAFRSGLLNVIEMKEPCNLGNQEKSCLCNEYGVDFPTKCYQIASFLREKA